MRPLNPMAALSAALLAALALAVRPAAAQELSLLVGAQRTPELKEDSYAYLMEYRHNFNDAFFATYSWLNEGHVTNHHRDGLSGQLWARWVSPGRGFTLAAGAGPYRYYDTTYVTALGTATDAHNWGGMYSVSADWYYDNPWIVQLRYNYVHAKNSIATHSLLLGIGYQFESGGRQGPVPANGYGFTSSERNEITVMLGSSVVNNFHSPHGLAYALEYRYKLTPYIDLAVTGLNEGDAHVVKRRGIAGEGYIRREFLEHRMDVGLGGGFYLARDQDEVGKRLKLLGIITMTLGYRFDEHWGTRAYWYRTVTINGRDTDVALLGLVYSY